MDCRIGKKLVIFLSYFAFQNGGKIDIVTKEKLQEV